MRTAKYILAVAAAAAAWALDAGDSVNISEVEAAASASAPPVFVELYNAAAMNVALGGWSVRAYTRNGVEAVKLPDDAVIPARGFYLVGRAADADKWSRYSYRPDCYTDYSLEFAPAKGGVLLVRPSGENRDAAGWGAVPTPYFEGTPHSPVGEGHSLERKSGPEHSEIHGNSYDTGNNANDLRERAVPEPQNINSPREYPSANTEDNAWGRIKAMYYGQ